MKGILVSIFVVFLVATMTGCAGYMTPVGYGSASSALIYTKVGFPSAIQDMTLSPGEYRILGPADGEASSSNILGMVASGDAGVFKAYKNALQKTGGDDLINVKVDTEVFSILGLFTNVTTKVYGQAIKYQK